MCVRLHEACGRKESLKESRQEGLHRALAGASYSPRDAELTCLWSGQNPIVHFFFLILVVSTKKSYVFWDGSCQPMVLGANLAPTRIPSLGCYKKREVYSMQKSSNVILQHYEAALGSGPSLDKQLPQLLAGLLCSALLQRDFFCVSAQPMKVPSHRGAGLYIQKSYPLGPDW